ncbi:C-type lectin domain family 12 member A-like [Dipodomys spectabilis]|uniref:C-type lectin domain family 12 member A-like n=1 Tax=Dipodomys spectabilis TaxID=105255 RepID=UPI001C54B0A9|nr:C-type lectin domain family 12 member A-like [Dipodomys spectabilis]
MSEEEIIYADLNFQNSGKTEKIQELDPVETKAPPVSSHVCVGAALGLTLLSLLLLFIGLGILGGLIYKKQNVQEERQTNVFLQQVDNFNCSEKIQNVSIALQTLATRLCRELQEKEPGHKCKPCPPNWLWHANRCYLPYHIYTTWQNSKRSCADRNASLLKINNKDTLEFVKSRQLFHYWLGASPRHYQTNSMTVDQSAASSIWLKNKPSAFNGMYCAYMTSDMRIAYDNCLASRYAMCEKMAGPVRVESVLG